MGASGLPDLMHKLPDRLYNSLEACSRTDAFAFTVAQQQQASHPSPRMQPEALGARGRKPRRLLQRSGHREKVAGPTGGGWQYLRLQHAGSGSDKEL